jgi:hypothetical protein
MPTTAGKKKQLKISDNRLKFLLLNKIAKLDYVKRGNRKGLQKVITIGERHYNYNPIKITKILDNTLDKLTKDNKQFTITEAVRNVYDKVVKSNVLTAIQSYTINYKASIHNVESSINAYANSIVISDIKMKGYKGLSYLQYQKINYWIFLKQTLV